MLVAIGVTTAVSWMLYEHTVNLLTDNLRQRLLSIAITQAANINAQDIEALQIEDDWQKPEWAKVVTRLKRAKDDNPNIVFMYIFRKKASDPTQMEFVADAESINPYVNLDDDPTNDVDANGDGIVEPDGADNLQWPGQDYPEPPEETFEAYSGPLTNRELYEDAYGQVLTGYAPIKDESGNVVAVIGTDIKVNDFLTVTRQTLYPFLSFILFLVSAIIILSVVLIKLWNKRVEIFAEVDRQKDEVMSIIVHQLLTPINAVKWTIELLESGDSNIKESIQIIQDQAKKLENLATAILEATRIQLGRVPINFAPLDLNIFFKGILDTVSLQAKEKKVKLTTSVPSSLPIVMLDGKYTQMTIENLLSNAVKYTPTGGKVDFIVKIQKQTMYCTVKDTGVGIPKKDHDQVFGKMYRASNVAHSDIGGNGLGLYAAKGAIEAQGGKIRFESEENKGTTFFVEVPLKLASAEEKKAQAK